MIATAMEDGLPCLIAPNIFVRERWEFSGGTVDQTAGGFRALRRTPSFALWRANRPNGGPSFRTQIRQRNAARQEILGCQKM